MNFCKKYISMISITCLLVLIMTACGSYEEKTDEAFDLVKKERMMSADTTIVGEVIIQQPKGDDLLNRTVNLDEWTKFHNETVRKIRLNNNKIKILRGGLQTNNRMLNKLNVLEKNNNELIIEMDQFNDEVKLKHEQFKISMNENLNRIGNEINTMKINHNK